jgi:hypothetical protein
LSFRFRAGSIDAGIHDLPPSDGTPTFFDARRALARPLLFD